MNLPKITRWPEPALVRSVLVAITGVIAYVVGHSIDTSWITTVLDIYTLFTPVVAGAAIRPVVTPVEKPTTGGQ
ncbi:hypothetical protein ACFXG4_27100 [Nocardia sp. NPDC059246]|uniref:hypothetical protein n=1 Tax=unclassified Nocardia TaxID=2637762 RepID=UPI00368A0580